MTHDSASVSTIVNLNGQFVAPEHALISVFDHGFLFGDSVYEVVRTVGPKLFTADEHLARLEASAALIGLRLPKTRDQFKDELAKTHAATSNEHSYLRLIVTRGVGELELLPDSCKDPAFIIIAKPLPTWGGPASYEHGIAIAIVDVQRNAREALNPAIKSGNYLNNVLALVEARSRGGVEGIMCNAQGFITEGTTSNIFCVREGSLSTPALDTGILPGITRSLVIRLARQAGIEVIEGNLRPNNFTTADEVFITSTTRGVMPVTQIDGQPVGTGKPGPLTQRLRAEYEKLLTA